MGIVAAACLLTVRAPQAAQTGAWDAGAVAPRGGGGSGRGEAPPGPPPQDRPARKEMTQQVRARPPQA